MTAYIGSHINSFPVLAVAKLAADEFAVAIQTKAGINSLFCRTTSYGGMVTDMEITIPLTSSFSSVEKAIQAVR